MAVILGGNDTLPQITLTQSQTFVPPQDGNVCIHVVGAGGSGGARKLSQNSGGAGGYCKKNSLAVTTAGSFTVVVGVGGASHGPNSNTVNAGGNSTVAGTGLSATLTANGGGGAGPNTGTVQGAGGTAANGDVNNTGGAGAVSGGGGAVGIYGTGAAGRNTLGGGVSDAQGGGLAMSGFGEIVGGSPQAKVATLGSGDHTPGVAGDLCGGALCDSDDNTSGRTATGGYGGIGGGGGAGDANQSIGGRGGDGLVLIQYLPS